MFRILAAIGLFAVGVLTHSKILTFLGIPMLLSIPMNYRMGRTAAELRKRGLPPVSEDAQTIPPETAQAIITEVKKTMPKGRTSRMVADQTLQIFEMLNARPPGWIASIGPVHCLSGQYHTGGGGYWHFYCSGAIFWAEIFPPS